MNKPSEGEAMLMLADQVSEKLTWKNGNKQGLSDWFSLVEINLIIKALRAAAQSSGVREPTLTDAQIEQLTNGIGSLLPATEVFKLGWRCALRALSPDTPREGEK